MADGLDWTDDLVHVDLSRHPPPGSGPRGDLPPRPAAHTRRPPLPPRPDPPRGPRGPALRALLSSEDLPRLGLRGPAGPLMRPPPGRRQGLPFPGGDLPPALPLVRRRRRRRR